MNTRNDTQLEKLEAVSKDLDEIERIASSLYERYGLYDGQAERYTREARKSFLNKMLTEWAGEHAPYLPQSEIDCAIQEAERTTGYRASMKQLYTQVVNMWTKDNQAQHLSDLEHDRTLANLVPARFYENGSAAAKLRPSSCVLRVSLRVYSYYGTFSLYDVAGKLRLLNEAINQQMEPENPVDLADLLRQVKDEGKLGTRYACSEAHLQFIKPYKNGKMDLWFKDREAADKVATVLLDAYARQQERFRDR